MKKALNMLLLVALTIPLFTVNGCASNDSHDRMGQHMGGK